jgi:putative glutathione S-transferase
MEASTQEFSLGRESGDDGAFARQDSAFRDWVSTDGSTPYPAEAGRYHIYAAWACPWAQRAIIGRQLKGLEDAIGLSIVHPIRDSRGWRFTGGEYTDDAEDFEFLAEAYNESDPEFDDRASTPVLWDTKSGRIVNNESGDVLRMLGTRFEEFADPHSLDLYPEPIRAEIDNLNERIYDAVNNGVYKAGFTTNQEIYERQVADIFAMLDELDERLGSRRFLFGELPVATDWRLFTTLLRFDAVYYIHFKCSLRRLVDYTNLWPYARDLYQWPGIADTVRFDDIRRHYFCTHPMINPNKLVAVQPDADWAENPGRN